MNSCGGENIARKDTSIKIISGARMGDDRRDGRDSKHRIVGDRSLKCHRCVMLEKAASSETAASAEDGRVLPILHQDSVTGEP